MEQNNNIRQLSQEILNKARICLDYEYFRQHTIDDQERAENGEYSYKYLTAIVKQISGMDEQTKSLVIEGCNELAATLDAEKETNLYKEAALFITNTAEGVERGDYEYMLKETTESETNLMDNFDDSEM